jgi:hypothetical protein
LLKPLHILIAEDSEDDCLLLLRELRRSSLAYREWDIVISDYVLSRFSRLDLPFVIVSGNIGEASTPSRFVAGCGKTASAVLNVL